MRQASDTGRGRGPSSRLSGSSRCPPNFCLLLALRPVGIRALQVTACSLLRKLREPRRCGALSNLSMLLLMTTSCATMAVARHLLAEPNVHSDPAQPVRVELLGSAGCGSADAFFKSLKVHANVRLAAPEEAAEGIQVWIEKTGAEVKGRLEIQTVAGVESREVSAANCAEVLDTLALSASMSMVGASPPTDHAATGVAQHSPMKVLQAKHDRAPKNARLPGVKHRQLQVNTRIHSGSAARFSSLSCPCSRAQAFNSVSDLSQHLSTWGSVLPISSTISKKIQRCV